MRLPNLFGPFLGFVRGKLIRCVYQIAVGLSEMLIDFSNERERQEDADTSKGIDAGHLDY
jgi:hypothetical protein